jgi:crossover junction endodeoxyribonuclease RusA
MPQPDLIVDIPGKPAGQGSLQLWSNGDGTERAKHPPHTVAHRNLVVGMLAQAWAGQPPVDGPVAVRATFYLPRPKAHFGTGRNAGLVKDSAPYWPVTKNRDDLDKFVRLVGDALVIAGVLADDSQVVVWRAEKRWHDTVLGGNGSTVVEVFVL